MAGTSQSYGLPIFRYNLGDFYTFNLVVALWVNLIIDSGFDSPMLENLDRISVGALLLKVFMSIVRLGCGRLTHS